MGCVAHTPLFTRHVRPPTQRPHPTTPLTLLLDANGDEHAPGRRKLVDKRLRDGWCRRADMDNLVRRYCKRNKLLGRGVYQHCPR